MYIISETDPQRISVKQAAVMKILKMCRDALPWPLFSIKCLFPDSGTAQAALAKKPPECLEYVILHELTHLKTRNHGKDFVAFMDEHIPYWREIRKKLNDSTLDYME